MQTRAIAVIVACLSLILWFAVTTARASNPTTGPLPVSVASPVDGSGNVKVALQGTSPISGSVTVSGSVSASQSGSWAVTDPDAPGKQDVLIECAVTIRSNQLVAVGLSDYTVPASKRLVIEVIHLFSFTDLADRIVMGDISTHIGNRSPFVSVPVQLVSAASGLNYFDGQDNLTRTYADAGSTPTCDARKESTGTGDVQVQFMMIGYLISVP